MEYFKNRLKKETRVGFLDRLENSIKNLNFKERMFFYFFAILLVISASAILFNVNKRLMVEVPLKGGDIVEGVIGSPRFINPLLSISDTDRDLTSLVYSGLTKATPEGELVNDLAESYEISPDGLRYVFTIRDNASFHDGEPVTADDVIFTVDMAKNDILKSPRRASWEGVLVQKINNKTVAFNLGEPYSPFLENTTLGILPRHIWGELTAGEITFSEFNSKPIGSGPFEVKDLKKDSSGIPTSIKLKAFKNYALGRPYINEIEMKFFDNEKDLVKAFNKKDINNIHAISAETAREIEKEAKTITTSPLPRVFGLFFNQSQATVFTNLEVRRALDSAVPKERIVSEILNGFGTVALSPLPPGIPIRRRIPFSKNKTEDGIREAIDILERNGWQRNENGIMVKDTDKEDFRLSFSISTSNAPELKAVANILKEEWQKIGAEVELKFFETGALNQEVIRPRRYDSLLFGEIIGRDFDLFAFWHSSQRNDPGLNIALYANITADKLLEDIRKTSINREKEQSYLLFEEEVKKDIPAIFLYSPDFILASNENIKGLKIGVVTTPAERFLNVHEWHLKTEKMWPFFIKS